MNNNCPSFRIILISAAEIYRAQYITNEKLVVKNSKDAFDRKYQRITGFSVPLVSDVYPYYVWPPGTNKWGIELRLYFLSDASMPDIVQRVITANSRMGYEHFDFRINNNKIIWELFANGFHLGNN